MNAFKKPLRVLLCVAGLAIATSAYAAEVEEGLWKQTSTTAGDCADCMVTITKLTPHIVRLEANNGWIGIAYYDREKDEYRGFLELTKMHSGTPEDWINKVFMIRLIMERMTLNLEGEAENISFSVTYRKQ